MEKAKKILIVAGEASGDLHAANLVKSIKELYPNLTFFGLGGKKLKAEGLDLYHDLTGLAVVGFFEVLKNLKVFRKIFVNLLKKIDKKRPDLAILVDYPGFNLRLAEKLHKRNIPVIYYISPQIWAWGKNRIRLIKRSVSKMIVFFPFEERLYKKHNIDASCVGHPLLDFVKPTFSKDELFKRLKIDTNKITLALLPGSREKEINTLLPIMLETAKVINEYFFGRIQFLILRSPAIKEEILHRTVSGYELPLRIISDMTYDGLSASDFALVCSGTATLETALIGTPMVILYKVNFLSWAYIRLLIKIPYIGLVNVVGGKKIVEEFIQFDCSPQKICDYVIPLLQNRNRLNRLKLELLSIKESLGRPGASLRAAGIVVDFLKKLP
jgi:lipid-A-disaccharide synthase